MKKIFNYCISNMFNRWNTEQWYGVISLLSCVKLKWAERIRRSSFFGWKSGPIRLYPLVMWDHVMRLISRAKSWIMLRSREWRSHRTLQVTVIYHVTWQCYTKPIWLSAVYYASPMRRRCQIYESSTHLTLNVQTVNSIDTFLVSEALGLSHVTCPISRSRDRA